jgi:hypothetical protein
VTDTGHKTQRREPYASQADAQFQLVDDEPDEDSDTGLSDQQIADLLNRPVEPEEEQGNA